MNKGFILDGYPRNIEDAKAIFLEPIPGYTATPDDSQQEESKAAAEESKEPTTFPGFTISEKILPQYTVIFEADNDFLKQKMKDLPPEVTEGTNKSADSMTRRLGVYREMNSNVDAESHIHNFFSKLIGIENCMLLDNPEMTANQEKTLNAMRDKLEQNGKPCCLNLITENDNRFLKNIERIARREAREAALAKRQAEEGQEGKESQRELEIMENPDLTEEQKQEMLAAEKAKEN